MSETQTARNLKGKFEELAKPEPEPDRHHARGKVAWDDFRDQGLKKLHKKGMTTFGNGPPPKKDLSQLP